MTTFSQLRESLRNVPVRKFVTALQRDGFAQVKGTSGAHHVYEHLDGRRVIVPYHKGGVPPTRTALHKLLEATEWNEDDAVRLNLKKRR